jgi:hypothetical protein
MTGLGQLDEVRDWRVFGCAEMGAQHAAPLVFWGGSKGEGLGLRWAGMLPTTERRIFRGIRLVW